MPRTSSVLFPESWPARLVWLTLYVAWVGTLLGALAWTRATVLAAPSLTQRQAEWQTWVQEAERQADGEGPVRRRPPKTNTAPAVLLMRDYFPICLAAAWLFGSALYVTFAFLARGMWLPADASPKT